MDDIYENTEEYNPNKEPKILIVFDGMIADIPSSKKNKKIKTELFTRGKKLSISLVFITQSCSTVLKMLELNYMHYFIIKTPNKRELQQIAINHSLHIEEFINLYEKCTANHIHF